MDRKIYLCIDLKSFFASCECVERGLDPMTTNLVVADKDRGRGGICLAITPAMKRLGIKNRCRLFEIPDNVDYIIAKPRMKLYMDYSTKIYSIYLRYVDSADIHVYSIDECFLDITPYLKTYRMTARMFAKTLMRSVLDDTGISATCGIGTNLFLAKLALDVTAKHAPDMIGFLDDEEFKAKIWHHRPITDIWNVGRGIANRLEKMGVYDLYGVTQLSEERLYEEFGVNAELLIDHAHGVEPCTIKDIKNYKSKTTGLSNSQILFKNYDYESAFIVIKEMIDLLSLEITDKGYLAGSVSLYVGYGNKGVPAYSSTMKLKSHTNSFNMLKASFRELYERGVSRKEPIRKVGVGLNNLVRADFSDRDIFTDDAATAKEMRARRSIAGIKDKFGKNSILRAMDYQEMATAKERNKLIGGHNGGEDEDFGKG